MRYDRNSESPSYSVFHVRPQYTRKGESPLIGQSYGQDILVKHIPLMLSDSILYWRTNDWKIKKEKQGHRRISRNIKIEKIKEGHASRFLRKYWRLFLLIGLGGIWHWFGDLFFEFVLTLNVTNKPGGGKCCNEPFRLYLVLILNSQMF